MKSSSLILWLMFAVVSSFAQTAPTPVQTPAPAVSPTGEISLRSSTSAMIGFSISMPEPVRERMARGTLNNGAVYAFEYSSVTATTTFQVVVTYLTGDEATPVQIKKRFREVLEKVKTTPKQKWLSGGDYPLEGNPGIEYKIELEDGAILWVRQIFAFGKVYETSVRFSGKQPEPKAAATFMESLKILRSNYTVDNLPPGLFDQTPVLKPVQAIVAWVEGVERVSGQVLATSAVKKVMPKIPITGMRGTAQLLLVVSEAGKLVSITAISGDDLMKKVCIEAVNLWVFEPISVDGKPAKVQGVLAFKFGD